MKRDEDPGVFPPFGEQVWDPHDRDDLGIERPNSKIVNLSLTQFDELFFEVVYGWLKKGGVSC